MTIAFPGAQGYGAGTRGARARSGPIKVYKVTNLNDSGKGSFRAACEASGPRIVIFDVGGTITCRSSIEIRNPYITILGQTAPGGGITITRPYNKPFSLISIGTMEVIVRYIRLRGEAHPDVLSHSGDCLQIGSSNRTVRNVIIDHCSMSWATDETVDTYPPNENVTIQWCFITQALRIAGHEKGDHNFGILLGPGAQSISLHHCYMAHNEARVPKINTGSSETIESINNVIYNTVWRTSGWGGSHVRTHAHSTQNVNYINNIVRIGKNRYSTGGYYISGDSSVDAYEEGTKILEENGADVTGQSGYEIIGSKYKSMRTKSKHSTGHSYPITIDSTDAAWDRVLDGAGVTIPLRDSYDEALARDARNGTGKWINRISEVGGLPRLSPGQPWNSGSDGLPKKWAADHGGVSGPDIAPSGYTWLEEWSFTLSGDDSSGGNGEINRAPTVDVGPNVTVTLPNQASLKATVKDDGLPGGPLTYLWTQVEGPDDAVIESPNAKETAVTFPIHGDYRLRLTVSDGELEGRDELRVTVRETDGGDPPPAGDLTFIVAKGNDDAAFSTDKPALNVSGRRIYAGHYDAARRNYRALMRFQNVGLTRRSTVTTAYLSLYVTGINEVPPALRIYALDEDDSADLSNATDVEVRLTSLTAAYVDWMPEPGLDNVWVATPDIAPVIDEILARPGWNSGQALTLVVQPVSATYSKRERVRIAAYDADPSIAARLEISGVTESEDLWVWPPVRIGARIGIGF